MHPEVVKSVSRENNLVLFDGGSKMLEVARFGGKLAKSSIFLIHDWEDETFEAGGSSGKHLLVVTRKLPQVSQEHLNGSGSKASMRSLRCTSVTKSLPSCPFPSLPFPSSPFLSLPLSCPPPRLAPLCLHSSPVLTPHVPCPRNSPPRVCSCTQPMT